MDQQLLAAATAVISFILGLMLIVYSSEYENVQERVMMMRDRTVDAGKTNYFLKLASTTTEQKKLSMGFHSTSLNFNLNAVEYGFLNNATILIFPTNGSSRIEFTTLGKYLSEFYLELVKKRKFNLLNN